ncbi:MAG: TraM recognition domain-containing protein [Candidatus Nanopelagicales bacterium]
MAAHDAVAPWLIVASAVTIVLATTAVWVAGGIASLLTTGRWPQAAWSPALLAAATGRGEWAWDPAVAPGTVQMGAAFLLLVVLVPSGVMAVHLMTRGPRSDSFYRALGVPEHVASLQLPAQRQAASRLRTESLSAIRTNQIPPTDAGVALGRVDTGRGAGPTVYAGWEDVMLALMAPRSGKTTSVAIPAILSAPGAVVATSNKLDLLYTARLRQERTGVAPWVFDPQSVARTPRTWWWNPLAGVTTVEEAERLAGHFISTVADSEGRDAIWPMSATELLSALFLAATNCGADVRQVYKWLANEHDPAPAGILDDAGFDVLASSLRGLMACAPETRASVYFTARSGARCLRNPQITDWVTPSRLPRLDPAQFVTVRSTLYLLSKDSGGSAAPLVAALTDRVLRAGEQTAEARGGRLDPPLVVVLDEAASVAPIRDLPKLYSHYGSRGIMACTILQSMAQGEAVWGRGGMEALWAAATIKLVGAGIDSEAVASQISKLIGEQDVATVSITSGRGGSRSTSLTSRPVLTAAQVRAIPKGTALLMATGSRPVLLRLDPFYTGPDAAAVTQEAAALTARIAEQARS